MKEIYGAFDPRGGGQIVCKTSNLGLLENTIEGLTDIQQKQAIIKFYCSPVGQLSFLFQRTEPQNITKHFGMLQSLLGKEKIETHYKERKVCSMIPEDEGKVDFLTIQYHDRTMVVCDFKECSQRHICLPLAFFGEKTVTKVMQQNE